MISFSVSVCPVAYLKNDVSKRHEIATVARSSSDDNAIRNPPVLGMTSHFAHDIAHRYSTFPSWFNFIRQTAPTVYVFAVKRQP